MLLFVYTTALRKFVIFTSRYFKLRWNTTALSQSNCRNFSWSSITYEIGPLQLTIHVPQNRHACKRRTGTRQTKEITIYNYVCPYLSCPTATFCSPALRFVPPEWLAAKGLFTRGASIWFLYVCSLERKAGKVYSQLFSCDVPLRSIVVTTDVLYR